LKWEGNLSYEECVELVGDWYFRHYNTQDDMYQLTIQQIETYEQAAFERGLVWA